MRLRNVATPGGRGATAPRCSSDRLFPLVASPRAYARLAPGVLFGLLLLCLVAHAGAATAPPLATLSGCVELSGDTAYRGVAALWPAMPGQPPDPRRAVRPPSVSSPLDPSGCFVLQAPPGDYFVGAVVRRSEGGWQGPPRPGDWVFLSPDSAGGNRQVSLQPAAVVDIGRNAAGWRYAGFVAAADDLAIAGRLTDRAGQPLAGLLVFAFADREMSAEPVAVAEPSDGDGRYLLRLPAPATVYLRARAHYGRRNPAEGGYMGVYGGETPRPLTVDADHRQAGGCDLTVLQIPAQTERNPERQRLPSR